MNYCKKRFRFFCCLFILPLFSFSQTDNVGSGRAILLDGVNDYIDLGNIYDDVNLPVAVSAWVKLDPAMPTQIAPVFVSQDNNPLYNGFWVGISSNTFFMEYGDGIGENNPAFRKGKSAGAVLANNQWVHVCSVMRSASSIELYVNGNLLWGNSTGESTRPMSSNFPADVAKIGYLFTNGVTHHFKGTIDEVRVWNRSLSQAEVRADMCRKLTGNETGLIGYWNFDETSGTTVTDKSTKGFNGTLMGGAQRVYSGAPIGDESVYLYPAAWGNTTVSQTKGLDKVTVSNVNGASEGIHIYNVNDVPSQTTGLNMAEANKPYFGVFGTARNFHMTFDVEYLNNEVAICKAFQRSDNSVDTWAEQPLTNILNRTEIEKIAYLDQFTVDLGADKDLCDQLSVQLTAPAPVAGKPLLWSTGETSSTITVSTSGKYWLRVGAECTGGRDTVAIAFLKKPAPFSLGSDEGLCTMTSRLLNPTFADPTGYDFTWQDGSKNPYLLVSNFGKYWLKAENSCGAAADTVTFSKVIGDKVDVDFGDDKTICDLAYTTLSVPAKLAGKNILWSTGQTSPSIVVSQSASYSVKVIDGCESDADTVFVSFVNSPPAFSLGDDEVLCSLTARFLNPVADPAGYDFTWQDGTKNPYLLVNNYGQYWLKVKNICGVAADTVVFARMAGEKVEVDLGGDKTICDVAYTTLSLPANLAGKNILWSTGQTSPSIVVSQPASYSVRVVSGCESDADTVSVSFVKSPPAFSLGDDEMLCVLTPRKLSPVGNSTGYQFVWQDGSTDSTFTIRDFGEYWVSVSNFCGLTSDKITLTPVPFDKNKIPNVITPGNDLLNEHFMIEETLFGSRFSVYNRWGERVYDNPDYHNEWNGAGLASGVYFFMLTGDCVGQIKGTVTVMKGN